MGRPKIYRNCQRPEHQKDTRLGLKEKYIAQYKYIYIVQWTVFM